MFIVERRGLKLKKGFFFWAFLLLFGALGLTMHIHYDPGSAETKDTT
jgi:hypothetical protein